MIQKPGQHNRLQTAHATQTTGVLHLINGEHFSGAERVQDLLAGALPEFGYDVGFVCVKPDKFPEVRQTDGKLFKIEMRNKLDLFCASRIVEIAKVQDYRVLHAHTPRTLLLGRIAAAKLHRPLVYHVHSPVGRDSSMGLKNKINTFVESWSMRGVDRMICVSSSLRDYMESLGHDSEKLSVVNNGVAVIEDVPERQPPECGKWTLGTMALFRPRKGTEVLLDALALLKDKRIPVQLRAVGPFETPEYEKAIMDQVERLGISEMIEWTGFQTDVNAQLDQMDLFVLPSLYGEGLPMVVLEAMANAVPVVASDVEGIPEAVRDGIDGLIFEPGSATDLAKKIEIMVADKEEWSSMSSCSLQRQRQELSDVSMARGVAEVYDELLNR